ncbi:MAG: DUF4783 domain-containing protein [Saprospiraceae bacterium]|nr:DUF4783 domain-containing protein [Saprospiraceae bacterium]MCF8251315.1 DUF4783 domain-containing protein [Saprospiraceae bacterium]MCF8280616.1 DUF4783 domain-containing protein [Bacteroidales bacterium]MCF8313190.1 DUF4783 domain-containing protein [Saprospiraceae bacterium]MCF8441646.1 DUF4783 domain-containing protein [Saprospiraceae bacterium]
MKNFLFVLLLAPSIAFVNTEELNLDAITKAISSGNADALGQYFDSSVEIAVLDKEETYTKAQAIQVMKDFFTKNKPSSFKQVHQGASKGQDSQYCIGNMTATSGTYRVYIYMKVSGTKQVIQELRFDKE